MTDILRPVLELSVIIPGILLAYLPVKNYLRQTPLKRCLPQIVLYRQICQQYTGNDYGKFKYRAKYVSHFRTSFGTEIP